MKIAVGRENTGLQRAGQLKLRSLFALMAVVSVFLAWERRFWQFREYDESPRIISILAMGLPLAFLLSGLWPRMREALLAVAPVVVLVMCLSCIWTTMEILMRISISNSAMRAPWFEPAWGSFLWGFGLPASLTIVAAAFELTPGEMKRHKYAVLTCVISLFNVLVVNLFAILLFTQALRKW